METLYKLKYTLYPTYDGDFSYDKEDYDEESGYYVHEKGTLWKICSKEEYCKLENYDEDEAYDFISDNCDFEYVAYMKDKTGIYMLINTLEDFEEVKSKNKEFLRNYNLPNYIKQERINDYSTSFNYSLKIAFEEITKSFAEQTDKAIIDYLYKKYINTDVSQVYVLSLPEFEKFLLEMLPKYMKKDE